MKRAKKSTRIEPRNQQTIFGEQPKEERPSNKNGTCENILEGEDGIYRKCGGVLRETSKCSYAINIQCMKCGRGWQRLI